MVTNSFVCKITFFYSTNYRYGVALHAAPLLEMPDLKDLLNKSCYAAIALAAQE